MLIIKGEHDVSTNAGAVDSANLKEHNSLTIAKFGLKIYLYLLSKRHEIEIQEIIYIV